MPTYPFPSFFSREKGNIPMSVRAIKAGAVEFLTKPCLDEQLLKAIRQGIGQDHAVSEGARCGQRESNVVTETPLESPPPQPAQRISNRGDRRRISRTSQRFVARG